MLQIKWFEAVNVGQIYIIVFIVVFLFLITGLDANYDGYLQTSEATHSIKIRILSVKVTHEDASGAIGAVPLTECMYKRLITYTADIPSWTSFDENVTYKFKRTVPVSIFAPDGIMTDTKTDNTSSVSITAYPGDFKTKKYRAKTIELAKKWQKQLTSDKNMLQRLKTVIEYHEYAKIESEKIA
ncbi:MAG: hypothetical protein LBC74_08210, partial [Planctomycetaceae bacterium]|nr:hypothetical protein [Planctomycetaceae bacterium]